MYPKYYKYPGDGYINWKVLVQVNGHTLLGTEKVYPNGMLLDPRTAYTSDQDRGVEITLEEAVKYTA